MRQDGRSAIAEGHMHPGFLFSIISWGILGSTLIVVAVVMQLRENRRNRQ